MDAPPLSAADRLLLPRREEFDVVIEKRNKIILYVFMLIVIVVDANGEAYYDMI